MALTLQSAAGNDSSVNNELLFVAYEATKANDETTYPDYSYVCDVYVDSVMIGRLKARPDPTYRMGKFDVSKLLQNYVSYGLKANYANATESYTNKIAYQLKFGEEYDFTLYTNELVDSSDREAYKTYEIRPFDSSAVIDNVNGDFATSAPSVIYSNKSPKWQLLPFFSNVSGIADLSCQFYNGAGSTVGSAVSVSFAGFVAKTIIQSNISFVKLSAALSQSQKDSVEYMIATQGSNSIRVNYECSKYPQHVIAWLNKYGGYDSYVFGLVSRKQTEITRKDFQQLNYRLNASGEVSYDADGVFYGGRRGYASNMKISLRMTSRLMNENEYNWISEMFHSPDVYLFDASLDKFIPVSIQETQYEYRNYLNSRLKTLDFAVNFSDSYNAQYL